MSITAMKQAVATLKGRLDHPDASDTIASLLAAIAEEEACVPVLCVSSRSFARMRAGDDRINAWFPPATEAEDMPLYTTPQPAPKQQPLTDEQIITLQKANRSSDGPWSDTLVFARAIEQAHGITGASL